MKNLIALFVLALGTVFAQSAVPQNEVFGNVGLSFPRTPAITTTVSATAGYGRTLANETFGSTEVIGTYDFTRATPKGGVQSFLGGVKQNFKSTLPGIVPFLSVQVGEATLLRKTSFATEVAGGVRFTKLCPLFGVDLGVKGTKVDDKTPMYGGVFVGLSKSF
jgi:hypothetical protein